MIINGMNYEPTGKNQISKHFDLSSLQLAFSHQVLFMTLGLEVASLEKKVSGAMSLATLGLGTCCLKGEASEEQAIGWDRGMHDIARIFLKKMLSF